MKVISIVSDTNPLSHNLFSHVPSKQWLWRIQTRSIRLKNSFFPQVVKIFTPHTSHAHGALVHTSFASLYPAYCIHFNETHNRSTNMFSRVLNATSHFYMRRKNHVRLLFNYYSLAINTTIPLG